MQEPQIDGATGGATEPEAEVVQSTPRGRRVLLALLLALGVGGAGAWWGFQRGETAQPTELPASAPTVDASVTQAARPLAEGDALLAQAAAGASNAAKLARLLATDGMISILTAAVNMVAEGSTPAPMLTFITLPARFSVEGDAGKPAPVPRAQTGKRKKKTHAAAPAPEGPLFISPASYARYDDVTEMATSLDPAVAARQYQRLRPYFDTAFQVIGRPGVRFEDVLNTAIQRLLAVKLLDGKVQVERKVLVCVYKDPALEALSPAEKQLLRMGPRNGKAIQDYLRKFSAAAGLKG